MRSFYFILLLIFLSGEVFAASDLVVKNNEAKEINEDYSYEKEEDDDLNEENEVEDEADDYGDLYDISSGIVRQLVDEDVKKPEVIEEPQEINKETKSEIKKEPKVESEKKEKVFKPSLSGRVVYDIAMNDEYQSTNKGDEFLDTRSRGRIFSNYNFSENFSLNSYIRFERMNQESEDDRRENSVNGGGDRSFENEGAFFEELNLSYKGEKHFFVVGKFNLNFGLGWRWNRGIWASDIASEYKQREKLGANGIYRIGDSKKNGRYEFSYAVFTNDRKNLDNSIITKRDSISKSEGKPGDTRSLQSYVAALDINFDFSEKEKLSYHFSYLNLEVNKRAADLAGSNIENQDGFVAGMSYKYPVNNDLVLDALVEYTTMHNVDGNASINEHFFTGNVMAKFENGWNIVTGYSTQNNSLFDKNLSEISLGYEFKNKIIFDQILVQFGYKNQRERDLDGIETRNSLGALLRCQKNF